MRQVLKRIGHNLLQQDVNATLKYGLKEYLAQQHLRANWCVYDIGAHHGGWAKGWIKKYPQDEIFLFEASASKQAILQSTGLKFIIGALGERAETREFFSSGSTGDSFFRPRGFDSQAPTEKISVSPLDVLVSGQNLRWPDFIKIDVQGSEVAIIRGGPKAFSHARFVLIETSFDDYFNHGNPLIGEVIGALKPHGFLPVHIFEIQRRSHSDRVGDPISQLNLLFAK